MRIVTLVGLMGAGKSTVATLLAAHLGWRALDLDTLVEARGGAPTAALFDSIGESGFRALEAAALREALAEEHVVLATGGGAPAAAGAMDAILAAGPAVWLRGDPRVLARRALAGGGRPLLEGRTLDGAASVLRAQLIVRAEAYGRATHAVDVDGAEATEIAATLLPLLRSS